MIFNDNENGDIKTFVIIENINSYFIEFSHHKYIFDTSIKSILNEENLLKKWLNNKFKNKLWSNKIKIKADNKIVEMIIFRVLHDK